MMLLKVLPICLMLVTEEARGKRSPRAKTRIASSDRRKMKKAYAKAAPIVPNSRQEIVGSERIANSSMTSASILKNGRGRILQLLAAFARFGI